MAGQCPAAGSPESARLGGLCSRSRIPWEGSGPHRVRGEASVEVTLVGGDANGRARKGLFDTFSGQSRRQTTREALGGEHNPEV